jgi:hypothetical protein
MGEGMGTVMGTGTVGAGDRDASLSLLSQVKRSNTKNICHKFAFKFKSTSKFQQILFHLFFSIPNQVTSDELTNSVRKLYEAQSNKKVFHALWMKENSWIHELS